MKTIHYLNKIKSHLFTIVPMAPFAPKSTSKLRSTPYASFPALFLLNPNNHYIATVFITLFDYNHCIYSDYLLCAVTDSAHIIR